MKIRVRFTAILLILSLLLTKSYYIFILLLAAAIHEIGHILMAKLTRVRMSKLELDIFGASLVTQNSISSYSAELKVAIAGPLFNFFSAATVFFFCRFNPQNKYTELFLVSSLFLGIINILPIRSFDGGRIFYIILAEKLGPQKAYSCITISSFLIIFSLWTFSIYLILKFSFSLSLFIFSVSLFLKLFVKETFE